MQKGGLGWDLQSWCLPILAQAPIGPDLCFHDQSVCRRGLSGYHAHWPGGWASVPSSGWWWVGVAVHHLHPWCDYRVPAGTTGWSDSQSSLDQLVAALGPSWATTPLATFGGSSHHVCQKAKTRVLRLQQLQKLLLEKHRWVPAYIAEEAEEIPGVPKGGHSEGGITWIWWPYPFGRGSGNTSEV